MSCSTPYATIWYTTNGSDPNGVNAILYAGPVQITLGTDPLVIKALGHRETYTDSAIATVTYTRTNDFSGSQENSTLRIRNNNNEKFILYKTSSRPENMLGGVLEYDQDFGVPNPSLGLSTLRIARFADYLANPAEPKINSSLLVYVDYVPLTYDIFPFPAGNCAYKIQNMTEHYIELRENSYSGPTRIIAQPYETQTTYFPESDYTFAVIAKIKRFDAGTVKGFREILLNDHNMVALSPAQTSSYTINGTDISGKEDLCAYLLVNNNSMQGVRMLSGSTIMKNSLDRQIVNPGDQSQYNLAIMPGLAQTQCTLQFQNAISVFCSTPATTFKRGYVYQVTIPSEGSTATVSEIGLSTAFFP